MTKYILNSIVVPVDFLSSEKSLYNVTLRKVTLEEVKRLIDSSTVSAVGHEATAKLLSLLLGREVQVNRVAVRMRSGDVGIHFCLTQRLPEGKVLSEEELTKLPYYFVVSTIQ